MSTTTRRSFSTRGWVVLAVVACCLLSWGGRPALAIRILMVGGDVDPTNAGDVGTYALLTDTFGVAAQLGDEGVFYMQGSLSNDTDAELVDVVFISSTLGSGTVRDKFEDAAVGVLNHEEALMHDNQLGNFFMVNESSKPTDSQLNIVEAGHPLAAGLPEGLVDVFTSPQTMSTGNAPLPEFDLAPDALVIAEVASDPNLKGIYAIEEGGMLLGDGTPGSPEVAPGRRVMFFLENQGGNVLTPDGEKLVIAAVEWLAGVSDPTCPRSLTSERDGGGIKLAWTLGTVVPTGVKVVRNGTELAASAPADPPQFVDATAEPGVLSYELTFAGVGADCRPLRSGFNACISNLSATVRSGQVELSWTNNLAYTQIQVRRGDQVNDQLIATLGGDEVSHTDPNPPVGMWTYSVVSVNGACEPVTVDVRILEPGYPSMVSEDGADAYWRLGEIPGSFVALNSGAAGPAADGTYTGTIMFENDSLLATVPDDPSIALDGTDGVVNIPDHATINIGGPFTVRTVELWFSADIIDLEPRILFEEGGNTRGLDLYVQEVAGDKLLVMAAWNLAEEQWGPIAVMAPITEGAIHHAVMVFVASEDDEFGNFDGRITGYLDGEEIGSEIGADRLYAHSNDSAIGGLGQGQAVLADGTRVSAGGFFAGAIDDVSIYNLALDDPNGDGDLGDSRVLDHFLAGSSAVREICDNTTDDDGDGLIDCADPDCAARPACQTGQRFIRGNVDAQGTINISDPIFLLAWLFQGGTEPPCLESGNVDGQGTINISDPIFLLAWLFQGGPQPPAPFLDCGRPVPDPGGAISCNAFDLCP